MKNEDKKTLEIKLQNFSVEQNALIKKQYDDYAKQVQASGQIEPQNSTELSFKLWEEESETNDWF